MFAAFVVVLFVFDYFVLEVLLSESCAVGSPLLSRDASTLGGVHTDRIQPPDLPC